MGSLERSGSRSIISEIGRNSSINRRQINEEPVFDVGPDNYTPVQEFTLDEELVPPNIDEFFPKQQIDPWHRMSALEHDCILLVEFSELEGPRPLMCIPDSPGIHFERNDFSVWLMTADYQASNHRSGPFSINEDIQMLLSNEEQGVHTYAHHFTLFDIEARGYVRPFCITYVTPDSEKLTRLFDALRMQFSAILRSVKTCNRRQFRKALGEAVEALNVIEIQAITSYYELYYDGKLGANGLTPSATPSSSTNSSPAHVPKQPPDVLNTRYRRLQGELTLAQNVVAEDLRGRQRQSPSPSASADCTTHVVHMDQWINSIRRGEGVESHKKTLKEFHELCPCVFDEFQRHVRSIWMRHRHWTNYSPWILEPRSKYAAKVNAGSIPILYLPADKEEENPESRRAKFQGGYGIQEYSTTEVDALHHLFRANHHGSANEEPDQKRLLLNIAQHLRYFMYPILTGQLLIAYGSDLRRQLISELILKLKTFIPTIYSTPRCSLWNDESSNGGQISESALGDYKIMGLRVGQKEEITDFVNEDMKRYVAMLDLNNDTFHVPDYKGDLLNRLVARTSAHKSDWTLILAILNTVSEYAQLAYVLYYSTPAVSGSDSNGFLRWKGGNKKANSKDAGRMLKLQNGDLKIVRYLVELLRVQDDGEERKYTDDEERCGDGLLLDYEPGHMHKLK